MKGLIALLAAASSLADAASITFHRPSPSKLIVDTPPDHVRPFVLPKLGGVNVYAGNTVVRMSIPGLSTGGVFTLYQVYGDRSESFVVQPHHHHYSYETFCSTKGRVQIWLQAVGGSHDQEPPKATAEQETRILTRGDCALVPPNTTHTFRLLEPSTQYTGVISPGGFEKLFYDYSQGVWVGTTGSEIFSEGVETFRTGTSEGQEDYDVFVMKDFVPRQDVGVNGAAGAGANWHDGPNALGTSIHDRYFVANGWGPKYLNTDGGTYKVIIPQALPDATDGGFSTGTMTLSPLQANQTAPEEVLNVHTAFQVEEGELIVILLGERARLLPGDVVFIPAYTPFVWFATAPTTSVTYVDGGRHGLVSRLLEKSINWNSVVYPHAWGFNASTKAYNPVGNDDVEELSVEAQKIVGGINERLSNLAQKVTGLFDHHDEL
ncbi:RmlC-like cupin [Dactylonectria estremocensis]|uniref:RmlC-like cupin n=1 Tax=Dactylonectria estremocensis TaxID=1079267 RepID=A0A9P9D304_9HYPO|nr:RmlC-like cupin [Dactylonectria estremocensis]